MAVCKVCEAEFVQRNARAMFCSSECRQEDRRQYLRLYYRENKAGYSTRKKTDHVGEKRFGIARGGKRVSKRALIAEIGKCELVCANCHRIRTHNRKQANNVA